MKIPEIGKMDVAHLSGASSSLSTFASRWPWQGASATRSSQPSAPPRGLHAARAPPRTLLILPRPLPFLLPLHFYLLSKQPPLELLLQALDHCCPAAPATPQPSQGHRELPLAVVSASPCSLLPPLAPIKPSPLLHCAPMGVAVAGAFPSPGVAAEPPNQVAMPCCSSRAPWRSPVSSSSPPASCSWSAMASPPSLL
uniref:Uncharacterized protein n=1 Tax=Arundo donax TaxID=35708 RepID=A0A0A9G224_ARUDO